MSDVYGNDEMTSFVTMNGRKLLLIIATGAVAGLALWGLSVILDTYIYKTILCRADAAVQCASSTQYATITAAILAAAVGLFGLVRLHVYRPLLIVIATFVSLWGLVGMVSSMAWYIAGLAIILLYGLSFGVFSWIARIRHFVIAIIVVIILVVAARFILNS